MSLTLSPMWLNIRLAVVFFSCVVMNTALLAWTHNRGNAAIERVSRAYMGECIHVQYVKPTLKPYTRGGCRICNMMPPGVVSLFEMSALVRLSPWKRVQKRSSPQVHRTG